MESTKRVQNKNNHWGQQNKQNNHSSQQIKTIVGVNEKSTKQVVKPYKHVKSQGHVKNGLPLKQVHAYCLLSCRDNSMPIFFLCRPTVTLHHGQDHRNEHGHIICHT